MDLARCGACKQHVRTGGASPEASKEIGNRQGPRFITLCVLAGAEKSLWILKNEHLSSEAQKRRAGGLPQWSSGRGREFRPWSGKIPRAEEQLSLGATAPEPALSSPCSATRAVAAMRSSPSAKKSSPHSPQLEKARSQQQRSAAKE